MRILYVSDHPQLYTGLGIAGRELCNRFSAYHDVSYLGLLPTNNPNVYPGPFNFSLYKTSNDKEDVYGEVSLIELLKQKKFDVLITAGDLGRYIYLAKAKQRKDVTWIHWADVNGAPIPRHWGWVLENIDGIVSTSEWAKIMLVAEVPHKGIFNIYRGYAGNIYKPMDKKKIKKEFGIEGKFVVGAICRNNEREDIPNIIKSFSLFVKQYTVCNDCNNIMLGGIFSACDMCKSENLWRDGEYKADAIMYLHTEHNNSDGWDINLLREEYEVWHNILMPTVVTQVGAGYPDDMMAKLFNSFDVYLSLSKGETFNTALLQAMACGVPTIFPDFSGHAEWARKGGMAIAPSACYYEKGSAISRVICNSGDIVRSLDMTYYEDPEFYHKKYHNKNEVNLGHKFRTMAGNSGKAAAQEMEWGHMANRWLMYLAQLDINKNGRNIVPVVENL